MSTTTTAEKSLTLTLPEASRRLGISPWRVIVFLLLGFVVGFWLFMAADNDQVRVRRQARDRADRPGNRPMRSLAH